MAFLSLVLIYLSVITGGILPSAAICLIIFPAVATISIDFKAGVTWGALTLLSWSLLFSGPHIGLPIQKAILYVDNGIAFYVSILITHSFIAFVALYCSEMSKTLGANLLKQRREHHC
jgi:hypothetical protein